MKAVAAVAFVVAGVVAAFAVYVYGWPESESTVKTRPDTGRTSPRVYTGRLGDVFRVPAAAAECRVFQEGGFPTLYCVHRPRARYQVYFYKDRLQVWRNGNPDGPVFSDRP
jgi:hypothetical protein